MHFLKCIFFIVVLTSLDEKFNLNALTESDCFAEVCIHIGTKNVQSQKALW